MTSVSKIVIRCNQRRRATLFFLSGFLLLAGVGILLKSFSKRPFLNHYVMPIGVIFLLAFIAIVFYAHKIFTNNIVLVIDDDGITDNSKSRSADFIPWSDVTEVKKKKVAGRKFICLFVNNPGDYLKNSTSAMQQKSIEFNKTFCDTPVAISSNGLSVDYYTLLEIIQRKYNLYKEHENYLNNEGISAHL